MTDTRRVPADLSAARASRGRTVLGDLLGEGASERDDARLAEAAAALVATSDTIKSALRDLQFASENEAPAQARLAMRSSDLVRALAEGDDLLLSPHHRGKPLHEESLVVVSPGHLRVQFRGQETTPPGHESARRGSEADGLSVQGWRTLRAGLLATLVVFVASTLLLLADETAGLIGLFCGLASFCLADYLSSRRSHRDIVIFPPTVARMGVFLFLALGAVVAVAAN